MRVFKKKRSLNDGEGKVKKREREKSPLCASGIVRPRRARDTERTEMESEEEKSQESKERKKYIHYTPYIYTPSLLMRE